MASRRQGSTAASNTCKQYYNTGCSSMSKWNGHIKHRIIWFVLCPLSILPVQADNDDSSSGEGELCGWPARQNIGEAGNAVPMPASCTVNRCVQAIKFWSTSVHGVWTKIHVRSPSEYAIVSLQLVCVWMFPCTHSTSVYCKMLSYTRHH